MAKIELSKLTLKVVGRTNAKILIELLETDVLCKKSPEMVEAFWDEFGSWIDQNRPLIPEAKKNFTGPKPMTDSEARVFGQTEMWFGKYKGDRICDVPLTYFDFMVGKDKHFMDGQARRYLANEKIAEQLRQQLEDKE